jgi:hypothetical protein
MRLRSIFTAGAAIVLMGALSISGAIALGATVVRAQEGSGGMAAPGAMDSGNGMDSNGTGDSMNSEMPSNDPAMPPPMAKMHMREPVTGSMMAAPPYGIAPMQVGFFVLATDPEDIGFLTYSWNFGDGTVSSLPPELYIYHTYQNPGTYSCSLTITTVDGRSQTFRQGVEVKAAGD